MGHKIDTRHETPIFVLGAARSGSSILALGLTQGAELPGLNESQVFPLLNQLLETVDQYFAKLDDDYVSNSEAHLIARLSKQGLNDRLTEIFKEIHRDIYQDSTWVDKTPSSSMLRAVPMIHRIYPEARFVFVKRRGIENILSRRRKFPDETFEAHCREWSSCMQAWQEISGRLSSQSIEIDQRDIGISPEAVAQQLGDFLQLSPQQTQNISIFWKSERPEQTAPAQDHKYTTLDETNWSETEKEFFLQQCRPMMDAYGYPIFDLSEVVSSRSPALRLFCPVTEVSDVVTENAGPEAFAARPGGFMLHPNPAGSPPATVWYRSLRFEGQNEFRATLELRNPQSAPVVFFVSVHDQAGEVQILEESIKIEAGPPRSWSFQFPPLSGPHHIKLQTTMIPEAEHNHGAWAIWIDSCFLISEGRSS